MAEGKLLLNYVPMFTYIMNDTYVMSGCPCLSTLYILILENHK